MCLDNDWPWMLVDTDQRTFCRVNFPLELPELEKHGK